VNPREALECSVDIEQKELVCFYTSQKGGLEADPRDARCLRSGQEARG
jgi:hypothetical protein